MQIDEKTRLDLRAKFEELMGPRLADATMEAMPPLDYDQLATKTDVANLGVELRGEMAELRGEMGELRGEMSKMLRTMVLSQLGTALAVGGFVVGLS